MPERFDGVYRVKRANGQPEALTEEFFNIRFRDVDLRVSALELLDISWQAALLQVRGEVLDRSEQVISDLRDKLISLTQLQWLTALSGTERTLVAGDLQSFAIDPDYRDLFTPGPFVLLSRAGTADDYAVARTSLYDRDSGQLIVETLVITGDPGPHSDWVISAIAGSTLAQLELLNQAIALQATLLAARDDAVAAATAAAGDALATAADRLAVSGDRTAVGLDKATVLAAKTTAVDAAAAAAASATSIGGGPVTSVAGLAGVVTGPALKTALNITGDISTSINAVLGGAGPAYDTLKELQDLMIADETAATALATLVATKANASALPSNGKIVGLGFGDSIGF